MMSESESSPGSEQVELNKEYPPELLNLSKADQRAIEDGSFEDLRWMGMFDFDRAHVSAALLVGEIIKQAWVTKSWDGITEPDQTTTSDSSPVTDLLYMGYVTRATTDEGGIIKPTRLLLETVKETIGFRTEDGGHASKPQTPRTQRPE